MVKSYEIEGCTVTLPEEITFDSGDTINTEDISIYPIRDTDGKTIALDLSAEIDGYGTVINHITLNQGFPFTEVVAGEGNFIEVSEYEHPDECPFDTINPISEQSIAEIDVVIND